MCKSGILRRCAISRRLCYEPTSKRRNGFKRRLGAARIVVWSKMFGDEVHEILAPLREQSDVYALRMSEVVTTISETEERSQLDVYYDLLGAGADVIRLRSLNGVGQSEWSLSDRADFFTCARDLVTAAARAADRPGQAVYRGRVSARVAEYIQSVDSLPGYGSASELVLHSKVPAGYGVQGDLGDAFKAPFPRRATIALNEGLNEASRAAELVLSGEGIKSSFERAPSYGVNANLCEAIANIASRVHGVGINLSWAIIRPSDTVDAEFRFSESVAEVFGEGAEWLRRRSPFIDAHVTGEIVRLDRESQEEFDGQAVMLYAIDNRPVALNVRFNRSDREDVVHAFRNSIEISIDGDIKRSGQRYSLENPRNFAVLEQMR